MQELLTFVAKSLVENPDQVVVRETEGPEAIILELNVAEEDMGKVIGKQGRIAKAIRAVVKAATAKNSKPVFVEIVEDK
ncbi:MAG: KH domain-containing protein [Clostridia bacterium]|nr:KH domain-containing protein [Clostridia bacterium]